MTFADLVIIGSGHAGAELASCVREAGFSGRIVLLGDEHALPYQRPPLSKKYLDGDIAGHALAIREARYYTERAIELVDDAATAILRATREVRCASGRVLAYGHLVLATGARNRVPRIEGMELAGVHQLRTRDEADRLRRAMADARRVVVVGAGFIGLEFAASAARAGAGVQVIELAGRVMERSVSPVTAQYVTERHRADGARFTFGARVVRMTAEQGVLSGVETDSGETLPADLALVGVGVVPNDDLAAAAALPVDNGVVVDEYLATEDTAISAIGDCANHPNAFAGSRTRIESLQIAKVQARCVAARLTGTAVAYRAVPWFWSDQGDMKIQIAGLVAGCTELRVLGDRAGGHFSVAAFRDGRLTAVESVNRAADHMAAKRLLAAGTSMTPEDTAAPGFDLREAARAERRAQFADTAGRTIRDLADPRCADDDA